MLADSKSVLIQAGCFSREVHLPGESRYELLEFIYKELPQWRDDPQRPDEQSETALTEHLCDFLTSAARMSPGWDILQFRTETGDEKYRGRKIDLVPKACGATLWIGSTPYTIYEPIMPIECKRLPTPRSTERDEREYVFSSFTSTGGIQRFKAGHHGSTHEIGAMIAYVQESTPQAWKEKMSHWIDGLAQEGVSGWSANDVLEVLSEDSARKVAQYRSRHARQNALSDIELRHLWVSLN